MNNQLPFVSIIVPVYNGEKVIGECMESLLNQDYPKDKYEIIIVDNNSKDKTAEVIKKYPVKYLLEDKIQSSYAARNAGAAIAKGEALAFFDADQIADSKYLKNLIIGWEDNKIGAFSARVVRLKSDRINNRILEAYLEKSESYLSKAGKTKKYELERFTKSDIKTTNRFAGGATICRRYIFEKIGGFDATFISFGDVDFGYRMQRDLNLSIQCNDNAILYHKERGSLRAFLGVEYRVGYGEYCLSRRYPQHKRSILYSTVSILARSMIGGFALFRAIFMKDRKARIFTIVLDVVLKWAYYFGSLHGFLKIDKKYIPAHW